MTRRPRPEYDSQKFRDEWNSTATLKEIAEKYGVTPETIHRAGLRRGLIHRRFLRQADHAQA